MTRICRRGTQKVRNLFDVRRWMLGIRCLLYIVASASYWLRLNMINIGIILILLVAPYLVAWVFHLNLMAGGRIGIYAVFFFAAIGHFVKTEQMMQMLASFVPAAVL
jgi:hypothetical protein